MKVEKAKLPILGDHRRSGLCLELRLLRHADPQSTPAPLLDLRNGHTDSALEPIQLLEGTEYVFSFVGFDPDPVIETDLPELFVADDTDGTRGRLRTGLRTGTVTAQISDRGQALGSVAFEVRSRKLDYLSDYRRMLSDIAERLTEVVMERFAAAEVRFSPDQSADAPTLYQRFAFLKSLILSESFDAALRLVVQRPHVGWEQVSEPTRPGRPVRGGSQLIRQLAGPGPHVLWASGPVNCLPAQIDVHRTEATFDTVPNRFVKFALDHWSFVLRQIETALAEEPSSGPIVRGRAEVASVLAHVDSLLAEPLFREVGRLRYFPAENQVLQKRSGYRDVARAYVQFEIAARLAWEGGDDVYRAGQKNVATLYEYWVFLELGVILSELSDSAFDFSKLLTVQPNGLGIQLRRRKLTVLEGTVVRQGRKLRLEYCFNRTFSKAEGADTSWSQPMRPDCSLKIGPAEGELASFEPVWIHFDAKYRVEKLRELFADDEGDDEEEDAAATAKRSDLLKMHAYRDAIRRSAGAYVIYPGTEQHEFHQYNELLPGLGAFALRPSLGGVVEGAATLRRFIDDVLDHVARQLTQHERARYWVHRAYAEGAPKPSSVTPAQFLRKPAADTRILLGYVKSAEHAKWIWQTHLYNLRADGRRGSVSADELAVDFLVLYGPDMLEPLLAEPDGYPVVRSAEELRQSGYPNPRGRAYLCLRWRQTPWIPHRSLDFAVVAGRLAPARPTGAPIVASWADILSTSV